jgi:hypothetical protein
LKEIQLSSAKLKLTHPSENHRKAAPKQKGSAAKSEVEESHVGKSSAKIDYIACNAKFTDRHSRCVAIIISIPISNLNLFV